jgi:hypothetical protein
MSFLHPEFLFWLLPPTLALFYFWLTQKPLQHRWLSEEVIDKLRAPETTMGLKGRNGLFFLSALLLVIAMAQPVILTPSQLQAKKLYIVMAIDLGEKNFGEKRSFALAMLDALTMEEVEIVAFDDRLYRVAPRSNDRMVLADLIRHLSPSSKPSKLSVTDKLWMQNNVDMMLLITLKNESDGRFLRISSSADILKVQEKLLEMKNQKRLQEHIPLFFYPLGMAMLLILIALSSMSKRRSVSVGIALFLMSWTPYKSEAGLLDFRLLNEAKRAYESGEYEKSERLYAQYQLRHDSPQVRYNRANALYMSGQFERSRYWYERVYTSDPILSERVSHNLEQSEIQIKRAELQKNKQETSATKEATPSHNTPSPSPKKATQTTRLFEW